MGPGFHIYLARGKFAPLRPVSCVIGCDILHLQTVSCVYSTATIYQLVVQLSLREVVQII